MLAWIHLNLESNNEAYLTHLRNGLTLHEPQLDLFLAKVILEKLDELSLQTAIGAVGERWTYRPSGLKLKGDPYVPRKMRLSRPRMAMTTARMVRVSNVKTAFTVPSATVRMSYTY